MSGSYEMLPDVPGRSDEIDSHNTDRREKAGIASHSGRVIADFMVIVSHYSKSFDPKAQSWTLCQDQGPHAIFTTVVLVFYVATLKIYQEQGFVGHGHKVSFNVITTALSLILALNFLVSFG